MFPIKPPSFFGVEGQLDQLAQLVKMAENLVNCTQYQTKARTPFFLTLRVWANEAERLNLIKQKLISSDTSSEVLCVQEVVTHFI